MSKAEKTTKEKQILVNQLVKKLNNNLALIHDLEDVNDEIIYKIESLKKDILIKNPQFLDDYEIQLSRSVRHK